jgi:hypothetical protein
MFAKFQAWFAAQWLQIVALYAADSLKVRTAVTAATSFYAAYRTYILLGGAAAIGVARVLGDKGAFYQAVAHGFVAWALAARFYAKDALFGRIGGGLTALEIACVLAGVGKA